MVDLKAEIRADLEIALSAGGREKKESREFPSQK